MRLALYYPWVYLKSGCERTIAAVLRHSRHDWTVFTNHFDREATFPELNDSRIVELCRVSVQRSMHEVLLSGIRVAHQRLRLEGFDGLIVFCEGIGDLAVFRAGATPCMCVCFTPLRAAFDPHYRAQYLERHGNGVVRRVALRALSAGFAALDRSAWRRYRHVIAISQETRSRIMAGGLRPGLGDIEVVHPGIETNGIVASETFGDYLLVPGRIMWTKNIELAIRAFRRVELTASRPMRLVIAGFVDEKSIPYLERLRALAGRSQAIQFVLSPTDEAMRELYRGAYAVVYPPFNEDLGLVPIEAMAWGKPVVAIDRGGPRETIVHGQTGYLVSPETDAFAAAMLALIGAESTTRALGRQAASHARRFEMAHFVEVLDDRAEQRLGRR